MITQEVLDALELVVADTKHERFRVLIAERPDDYIPSIMTMARSIRERKVKPISIAKSIHIRARLESWSGYGLIGEWIGKCLESKGYHVSYHEMGIDEQFLPLNSFVKKRIDRYDPDYQWMLQLSTPEKPPIKDKDTVIFTMWETTKISKERVDNLNTAKLVIVPCQWNKDNFEMCGVTTPIRVVPLGISSKDGFQLKPWQYHKPFTFGMAARMAHGGYRKGINEGMEAFVRAFPKDVDVALNVKVWPDCLPALVIPDDKRIIIDTSSYNPFQMSEWYAGIHCLFVPSKGEGWGLHTLQAMACGRPVIAAKFSGTAEFFDSRSGYELDFDVIQVEDGMYENNGEWGVPRMESMVETLKHVYRNENEAKEKGKFASSHASKITWDVSADKLESVIREFNLPVPSVPEIHPMQYAHNQSFPPLINQVINLGKSAYEFAKSGFTITPKDDRIRRLDICKQCPKFVEGRCTDCGCNQKIKVFADVLQCPLGKW